MEFCVFSAAGAGTRGAEKISKSRHVQGRKGKAKDNPVSWLISILRTGRALDRYRFFGAGKGFLRGLEGMKFWNFIGCKIAIWAVFGHFFRAYIERMCSE